MSSAGEYHRQGFNCCESILLGLFDYLGIKNDLIPQIATGFGGGIGHTGRICGALTGAIMALGKQYGRTKPQDKETRDRFYKLTEAFLNEAQEILGSINCLDLIGVPLNTEEGLQIYREKNLREKCYQIITTVEALAHKYLEGYRT
ncbi:MAG: C-GCAxxG-C-C family protein [Candidatus Caldatribacteriaceae bacterium]